jgi:hypothetical protein
MKPLVGVGGIILDEGQLRQVSSSIEDLCTAVGFPRNEPFKWSPGKDLWMRENLIEDERTSFFKAVLSELKKADASAICVLTEHGSGFATGEARTQEQDAVYMLLERFDGSLRSEELGIAIASRPSGGRKDEDKLLNACEAVRQRGTAYSKFLKIALNLISMPAASSRILQATDLVISITGAMVAGNTKFAEPLWDDVRSLLRSESSRVGGVGLKIHPDYKYVNLYHWLGGDEYFWRFQVGESMPLKTRPFAQSPDKR